MSMKEYDIDKLVNEMDFESNHLVNIGHNLMLTNHEIDVLNRNQIHYSKCISLKEIIREIEDVLEEEDIEELESISQSIAERDYYQNTNK